MANPNEPAAPAGDPDLEEACERALSILVESFDYPEAEARQRLNLWRARQHNLEGQALQALLPGMPGPERDAALLKWALEGMLLEQDLRAGADQLGTPLQE